MMNYHEGMSRAIDIQAHIRSLKADFCELVTIGNDYIQIKWEAFSVLFPNDEGSIHSINGNYEYKSGWYNGSYIVTCREAKPDET